MNKLQLVVAALATAGTLSLTTMAPASADSAASTRNIILGAAAIAGIAIESNVARKNAQARNINGYLPDGSAVYGDGHVTDRDGDSYYPGNTGQNVSCNGGRCYLTAANPNRDGHWNANDPGAGRYTGYDGQRNTNDNWDARERDGNNR